MELKGGVPKGEAQRAALHGSLKMLGECLPKDHRMARMAGPRPRRILFFASKALLCVSFQLNTPGLQCSLRNTCVNIPRVPVQKVNGGKTGSLDVGNENQ